jgi:hypothetical protein
VKRLDAGPSPITHAADDKADETTHRDPVSLLAHAERMRTALPI